MRVDAPFDTNRRATSSTTRARRRDDAFDDRTRAIDRMNFFYPRVASTRAETTRARRANVAKCGRTARALFPPARDRGFVFTSFPRARPRDRDGGAASS